MQSCVHEVAGRELVVNHDQGRSHSPRISIVECLQAVVALCLAVGACKSPSSPKTVGPTPKSIVNLPAQVTMGRGGYFPLRGRVLDSTDAPIAGAVPTYTPTDPGLLGIGPGAFLHSLGPLGSTLLIAAYSNGVTRVADTVAVTVDAFSSPSGTVVDSLGTPSGVFGVAASTSRVYVSTLIGGGPLLRLDLPVQSFDSPIGHVGAGLAVAFNPVGNTAFVAVFDQDSVAIVNATANSLDSYVTTHILGTPRDVIVSPDGQRVYVATDYTQIYVINATSKSVIDSVYVPGLPNHFTFHPSKPLLYVSLDNAQVAEINTDSGKAVRFFHTGSLNQGTAVAPDGG